MSQKFPSTARRPSGFTEAMEKAILSSATDITADGVRAVITKDATHADFEAAQKWFEGKSALDAMWVWWALERRDIERRTMEALGQPQKNDQEIDDDPIGDACAMLRKRFVYGAFRNEVFDLKAQDWIMTKALDNLMSHKMPVDEKGRRYSAFDLFKNDNKARRVHNERYTPGKKELIVEHAGIEWLNTWEAPTLKPFKGDVMPILNHILYFCSGRKAEAAHIVDWMAYMVQNPGKKINHGLLLISPAQGTGKDTMWEIMAPIVGEKNVKIVQDDDVNEGRNDFMRNAQLVVVPETMSGDRKDLANKLKPLITQPTVRVNEKNVKPYDIPNTVNFMMFSNHENAAYIEDKDRRYFVIICNQDPKPFGYFDDLYDNYIRTDKIGAFYQFLLEHDVSHFNPYKPAPDTPDKRTVQQATRGGVEAWLDDAWDSRAVPFQFEVVNLREALHDIQTEKGPRMTVQQIAAFLKKKGGGDLGKRRIDGVQKRIWAVRNYEKILSQLDDGTLDLTKDGNAVPQCASSKEHKEKKVIPFH